MKSLKLVVYYMIWSIISLTIGIYYMFLLIGDIPANESYKGFGFVLKVFYTFGIVRVGLVIGGCIALLFLIIDMVYLKKKLKSNSKQLFIRLAVLVIITILVAIVHYVLEKVIDVI